MDDQRNLLLALLLSGLVLFGYIFFVEGPARERAIAAYEAQQTEDAANNPTLATDPMGADTVPEIQDREILLSSERQTGGRIAINTPALKGSFSLRGMRFDDLELVDYDKTLKPVDGKVVLFSPQGSDHAAYIYDNWVRGEGASGADQVWSLVSGEALTPTTPVSLSYEGNGYSVTRNVSIDDKYLITLDDTVLNTSGSEIILTRKGAARQHGLPEGLTNFFILHEGAATVVDGSLEKAKYKKVRKAKEPITHSGESGWVALTDKYWLSAVIAPSGQVMTSTFDFQNQDGSDFYQAGYELKPMILSAGSTIQSTGHMFAGAKEVKLLNQYSEQLGDDKLDFAIDFGKILYPLTRPMTTGLNWLGHKTGNFGIAIMIMTLLIKLVLFPLNNKAYASQAKMKAVQPKTKKLQALYKEDPQTLRVKTMELYKKEGVNPVGGCLPMIPQIFIFFALYKTLLINVDMRHEPFFAWIRDLSAKDPLSILNGFGILPWDPVPLAFLSFFAIGPLALMYGASMAAMQTLTPNAATDPMQKKIFQLMPLIFMFILAPFAAGLLVYWVWNNILTFAQQYIITRRYGVETPFDKFFGKIFGSKSTETAE
ncbi:membrane protein insertase YidC [Robiginitomaculum antarcticum]|uniref:membrane protein insertase YidC n=1 Tax=Robiginitomaculum antarcticum TaxID=437507 RepID=UPI000380C03F|nr:membrane protein insertase YidC [Robiginitomaculum antarcticum]